MTNACLREWLHSLKASLNFPIRVKGSRRVFFIMIMPNLGVLTHSQRTVAVWTHIWSCFHDACLSSNVLCARACGRWASPTRLSNAVLALGKPAAAVHDAGAYFSRLARLASLVSHAWHAASQLAPCAPCVSQASAIGIHSPRRSRSRSRSRQEEARTASRPRCKACDCPDCVGATTGACPKYLEHSQDL